MQKQKHCNRLPMANYYGSYIAFATFQALLTCIQYQKFSRGDEWNNWRKTKAHFKVYNK